MRGSLVATFSEPDGFVAALRRAGYRELLVLEGGPYRARMTTLALARYRLSHIEERQPRIASISVPQGLIRIILPAKTGRLLCCGVPVSPGSFLTHGGARITHERVDGPCQWQEILAPVRDLTEFGRVLTGGTFALPEGVCLWRPRARLLRALLSLHSAAMQLTESRPRRAYGPDASHGLEQELINRLIECLSDDGVASVPQRDVNRAETMARFEQLLTGAAGHALSAMQISTALGLSDRTLRAYCRRHLGMSPSRYARHRRVQLVHRALVDADSQTATVAQVLRNHGFAGLGRFASVYRKQYGELPSETLRDRTGTKVAGL
jgi:AraC-like DNA-binding protein